MEGPGGVRILVTRRAFDPNPGTPHAIAGGRLLALAGTLAGPPVRCIQCPQVHGTTLFDADPIACADGPLAGPDADGLMTGTAGTMLVVRTADCVPVVLAAEDGSLIAALHCGWRGTIGGLLEDALARFALRGVGPGRAWMWIGPRICGGCYEVGRELSDRFRARFPGQLHAIDGNHVDLGGILSGRARELGLRGDAITLHSACTREAKELFPSHRRDANHRGLIYTGVWTTLGRTLA